MAFEEIEHFDRELILVHDHWIEGHQVRDQPFTDARVGLEMPDKIPVCENPKQLLVRTRDHGRARAKRSHYFENGPDVLIWLDKGNGGARPHDLVNPHKQRTADHSAGMKFRESLLLESAGLEQNHGQRIAEGKHDGGARSRSQVKRTRLLLDIDIEKDVTILPERRFHSAA